MQATSWSDKLWGNQAKFIYLLGASIALLFSMLGCHEIWTQEHRWADIVGAMLHSHDFLHPYLNGVPYYDKPLLSYWLIVAASYLTGSFSVWALRLPSAFAGLLAIWSIYRLGSHLQNKRLGLLAGWLLLTTFYFLFWARTSSADMLNMAGTLFAVTWYFEKKSQPSWFNYAIFFLVMALTALCKGLVGPIVTCLAIFPDLMMQQEWKKHLRLNVVLGMIPAVIVYSLPFIASTYYGGNSYSESGLYLVYRENILRYFRPFDHKGPIYTYFIYLPIYLLPWSAFFIFALMSLKSRWKMMSVQSKWLIFTVALLFLFFTLSGSRRNYYVLPIVPFAILMTADWMLVSAHFIKQNKWLGRIIVITFGLYFLNFALLQPLYYAYGGTRNFAKEVQYKTNKVKPWNQWQVVMLDPESKIRFYLDLVPSVPNYYISDERSEQTQEKLLQAWPVLQNINPNTVYITRKMYQPLLTNIFRDHEVVAARLGLGERLLSIEDANLPVAFIPKRMNL